MNASGGNAGGLEALVSRHTSCTRRQRRDDGSVSIETRRKTTDSLASRTSPRWSSA
jgi:hypothetical protein